MLKAFFIALWVCHAALSYRHRRKLKHTVIFSCTVSAYARRCYVQTSGACTGLLSCYSKELGTVELLQIKKLKKPVRPLCAATLTGVVHAE